MDTKVKTIVLGNEWDDNLRSAISNVLFRRDAKLISKQWGVGGSQEIEEFIFSLDDYELTLVSETYIGLLLTGPSYLVDAIADDVSQLI